MSTKDSVGPTDISKLVVNKNFDCKSARQTLRWRIMQIIF